MIFELSHHKNKKGNTRKFIRVISNSSIYKIMVDLSLGEFFPLAWIYKSQTKAKSSRQKLSFTLVELMNIFSSFSFLSFGEKFSFRDVKKKLLYDWLRWIREENKRRVEMIDARTFKYTHPHPTSASIYFWKLKNFEFKI